MFSKPILVAGLACLLAAGTAHAQAQDWTLVGWNNLGMHCMDADYSVFSLLPPYNTFHAQLIDPSGHRVRVPGAITVTYEAVADPDGSINSTAIGKTNFWSYVQPLFGADLAPDVGLAGAALPGTQNLPQPMPFDAVAGWFVAEGVPITPFDDALRKNPYPLMRLVARDGSGNVLATTDIVVPVSDEMTCRACHASNTSAAARPLDGWVNDPDPERDMRLNVLRLHDDREMGKPAMAAALVEAGYSNAGLYATVVDNGGAILCARCHSSEALPGSGISGIQPLTQAIHRRMAYTQDPITNLPLDSIENRAACYRCHPGAVTRCLRGVMGAAVDAADGTRSIQCQNCHGRMLDVASPERTGWLDEPTCQSCHTGTAVHNNGQIRYTTVFEASGEPRVAVDATFATTPDVPAAGLSLYRFSVGHGGLACSACHGSTHAELPSSSRNDNLQSLQVQGHVGTLSECVACHASSPNTTSGGPHGLHPLGSAWVQRHADVAEGGSAPCQVCHGSDYRGTVLSRALGDRTLATRYGNKVFWRGFQIGCYNCHRGPTNDDANSNRPAVVQDATLSTRSGTPVALQLAASDADGNPLELRIVSQPANGAVSLAAARAEYFPEPGYSGSDSFTFAAWDGSTDSNLGTVTVTVIQACTADCNGDNTVTIDEIILGVRIALGDDPIESCAAADTDNNNEVTIDELIAAINRALAGCST